jgi:lysophospholipase L1-like esterase
MDEQRETYNPWTVVNLVFHHLADEGLHPVLGAGDPAVPAAELLVALGIHPAAEGNALVARDVRAQLAELRDSMLGD